MVKIRVNEIDINPSANAEAGQASMASTPEQHHNFPGQMQILAFSALKDEMGDDWDQSKHRVHATVEKILTTELGPWDFSTLIGQDNYLIIYGEDNVNAAELTSRQIGKKVGAGFGGKIQSRLMDVRPQGDRLHKTIIEETDPDPSTGFTKAGDKRTQKWEDIPNPRSAPLPNTTLPPPALDSSSSKTDWRENSKTGFVPFWNARREILSGYAIVPYREVSKGKLQAGYDLLGKDATAADFLDLDMHMFDAERQIGTELFQNDFTSLLISQLHYDTLSSAAGRSAFHKLVEETPSVLRQFLMLQIVGIPPDTPASSLSQRIVGLPALFRAITVRIPTPDFPIHACASMGITSIAYEISPTSSMASTMRTAKKIISSANASRLLTTFEQVSDFAMAARLKEAGAIFLSGEVLGGPYDAPGNIHRLPLDDLASLKNR